MINNEITTAIGTEGLGEQSWWVQQWMELINSYRYKKRLERAWNYAREGNVLSIQFEGRRIHARVQGTEDKPYKIKLWLDILNDEDWEYVIDALAKKAKWSAQLLAGVMPNDIEEAFATTGKRLFLYHLASRQPIIVQTILLFLLTHLLHMPNLHHQEYPAIVLFYMVVFLSLELLHEFGALQSEWITHCHLLHNSKLVPDVFYIYKN